jgi:hypothetical protein
MEKKPADKPAEKAATGPDKPQVNPQTQKYADVLQRIVVAAGKIVYGDQKTAAGIVQLVSQAEAPEEGLAQATMLILGRLSEQMKGMNPSVVFAAAPMVVGMIAELAQAAKVVEPTPELLSAALEKVKAQMAGGQPQQAAAPAAPQEQQAPQEPAPAAEGLVAQGMEA